MRREKLSLIYNLLQEDKKDTDFLNKLEREQDWVEVEEMTENIRTIGYIVAERLG